MSEERDIPAAGAPSEGARGAAVEPTSEAGAPVSEAAPTETEVLAAVDRAGELGLEAATAAEGEAVRVVRVEETAAVEFVADAPEANLAGRPEIALPDELPTGGPTVASAGDAARTDRDAVVTAAATAGAGSAPVNEGVLISPDHPMAALYMQTPMPPDLKGNRGAGVLIAVLAALGFALVYAGVLALWLAPTFPPSTFWDSGLQPWLLSWPSYAAVAAFFVALVLVVLIVGRAGWWAYVLGGFLVALVVWAATAFGLVIEVNGLSGIGQLRLSSLVDAAFDPRAIIALVVAREVTVWFGAWIGSRGRKVSRRNAETLAEYEEALAEAQAQRA